MKHLSFEMVSPPIKPLLQNLDSQYWKCEAKCQISGNNSERFVLLANNLNIAFKFRNADLGKFSGK